MKESLYEFENLSTKSGFNNALGHFRAVSDIIGVLEDYTNIADYLNDLLQEKEISQNQILPAVNAVILDKLGYIQTSFNMPETIEDFSNLFEEVKNWNAVDIVIVYHHPDLGPVLINPKNKSHFDSVHQFKRNELITVYVGDVSGKLDDKLAEKAVKEIINFLKGKKIKTPLELKKGKYKPEKPKAAKPAATPKRASSAQKTKKSAVQKKSGAEDVKPAAAAVEDEPEKPKRMTPYYSVPVTNELFHNGNVEAWKKIIQSYSVKHPGLSVYIYYDGERIHDIHSLFKWGKVKHGSTILFAVAGDEIKDVAKLQRYLKQGASPMFEAFLNFPVNKILNLF